MLNQWKLGDPNCVNWGKPYWSYVDCPLFLNTKDSQHRKILEDFITFHGKKVANLRPEAPHPCGALNRALCKHLKNFDEVIELNGYLWLSDFMISVNEISLMDGKLVYLNGPYTGQQLHALHNRWWL